MTIQRARAIWSGLRFFLIKTWRRWRWSVLRTCNGRRFQTVVLACGSGDRSYRNDLGRRVTVWGCNFAYRNSPQMDRIYAMDHIAEWLERSPGWTDNVNDLGIPVVMQKHFSEVPKSTPLNLAGLRRFPGTRDYYINTICYMIADAIREGFGTIVIHRILARVGSIEYMEQKACLDFWAGVAHGLGIELLTSEDSLIGHPYPWQSNLYGYVIQDNWPISAQLLSHGVIDACRVPVKFHIADEVYGQRSATD
ncbi:MAG: hypothetical protein RIA64_01450 [Rhodospirillales bacterium]